MIKIRLNYGINEKIYILYKVIRKVSTLLELGVCW